MSRERVKLRHPKTGGEYEAPASAVPALAMSGWVPVDEPTDQGGAVPYDQGGELASGVTEVTNDSSEAEPVIAEEKSPRGRRKTAEEN